MWRGYASHLHTNTHPHTNTHTLHAHLDPGFHRFAKLLAESILDFHHVNLRKQSCESRLAVEVDALLFTHTLPITTLIHSLTHSLTHSHTRTLPHKSRTHSLTHSHKTKTGCLPYLAAGDNAACQRALIRPHALFDAQSHTAGENPPPPKKKYCKVA